MDLTFRRLRRALAAAVVAGAPAVAFADHAPRLRGCIGDLDNIVPFNGDRGAALAWSDCWVEGWTARDNSAGPLVTARRQLS